MSPTAVRRLRSDDWFRAGIETALDQISDRLAEKRRDSTVVSIAHAEIFRDPVPKLKRIDVQARRAWIVEMEEYIRARRSFYTERGKSDPQNIDLFVGVNDRIRHAIQFRRKTANL